VKAEIVFPQFVTGKIKTAPKIAEPLNTVMLKRLRILKTATPDSKIRKFIADAFKAAKGEWSIAKESLKKSGTDDGLLNKLDFINSLAEVSNDKQNVVTILVDLPGINNLRDLALIHSIQSLADILENNPISSGDFGDDAKTIAMLSAGDIMRNVFLRETSAVLQRMASAGELPFAEKGLGEAVAQFLSNVPAFNIRTTSIYDGLKLPAAFKGIEDTQKEKVTGHLKTLQRVQAISSGAEAVAALMNGNFHSAQEVADMPEADFIRAVGPKISEAESAKIHALAAGLKAIIGQMLMNLSELISRADSAPIDPKQDFQWCLDALKCMAANKGVLIDCENIFIFLMRLLAAK
jgi:hypothetical protein